jgi:hypothetical protein
VVVAITAVWARFEAPPALLATFEATLAPGVGFEAALLMVKIRQPSHEFTFGVGMSFIPYPLVLTPVV